MTVRWKNNLAVLCGSMVGTVGQLPSGDWSAHGCMEDWEDVDLGRHGSEERARARVEKWVEDHSEA